MIKHAQYWCNNNPLCGGRCLIILIVTHVVLSVSSVFSAYCLCPQMKLLPLSCVLHALSIVHAFRYDHLVEHVNSHQDQYVQVQPRPHFV